MKLSVRNRAVQILQKINITELQKTRHKEYGYAKNPF